MPEMNSTIIFTSENIDFRILTKSSFPTFKFTLSKIYFTLVTSHKGYSLNRIGRARK